MRLLTAALFLGLLLSLARAQTVFRVGCNTTNDGGLYRITCTEAEGSDTIVSYNYTINGVFQGTRTGGDFPIVIGKEDLNLGENTVKIVFTSARRATVELEILLRNF
ncbi:hypothetical protein GBAR_LOCUS14120, partial [Geodia barretti]